MKRFWWVCPAIGIVLMLAAIAGMETQRAVALAGQVVPEDSPNSSWLLLLLGTAGGVMIFPVYFMLFDAVYGRIRKPSKQVRVIRISR